MEKASSPNRKITLIQIYKNIVLPLLLIVKHTYFKMRFKLLLHSKHYVDELEKTRKYFMDEKYE